MPRRSFHIGDSVSFRGEKARVTNVYTGVGQRGHGETILIRTESGKQYEVAPSALKRSRAKNPRRRRYLETDYKTGHSRWVDRGPKPKKNAKLRTLKKKLKKLHYPEGGRFEGWSTVKKVIAARGKNPVQLLFRTKASALKYAREHGAKRFSIRKMKAGR